MNFTQKGRIYTRKLKYILIVSILFTFMPLSTILAEEEAISPYTFVNTVEVNKISAVSASYPNKVNGHLGVRIIGSYNLKKSGNNWILDSHDLAVEQVILVLPNEQYNVRHIRDFNATYVSSSMKVRVTGKYDIYYGANYIKTVSYNELV